MKKTLLTIKNRLLFFSIVIYGLILLPNTVFATMPLLSKWKLNIGVAGLEAGFPNPTLEEYQLPAYIGAVYRAFFGFMVVIFFAQMIWSGYIYITSKGNEEKVTRAKNMIMSSIVGIIISVASYLLTAFILKEIFTAAAYSGITPES